MAHPIPDTHIYPHGTTGGTSNPERPAFSVDERFNKLEALDRAMDRFEQRERIGAPLTATIEPTEPIESSESRMDRDLAVEHAAMVPGGLSAEEFAKWVCDISDAVVDERKRRDGNA